jgi:hypothetical protein
VSPGPCDRCEELQPAFRIRTPGDLQRVVDGVASELARGVLTEVTLPGVAGEWQTPFSRLLKGERDDLVLCRFRCTKCARLYSLSCETYHGSGGSWELQEEQR